MEFKKIIDYVEENKAEHMKQLLSKNESLRQKAIEVAEQNTKRNEEGLTVISIDDEWRE